MKGDYMADRQPQEKAPECRKCGVPMVRMYRYKKLPNSKNGKWDKMGWACASCETTIFIQR